jgi:hypothetical protein
MPRWCLCPVKYGRGKPDPTGTVGHQTGCSSKAHTSWQLHCPEPFGLLQASLGCRQFTTCRTPGLPWNLLPWAIRGRIQESVVVDPLLSSCQDSHHYPLLLTAVTCPLCHCCSSITSCQLLLSSASAATHLLIVVLLSLLSALSATVVPQPPTVVACPLPLRCCFSIRPVSSATMVLHLILVPLLLVRRCALFDSCLRLMVAALSCCPPFCCGCWGGKLVVGVRTLEHAGRGCFIF